jgi:hypothetical protein
MSHLPSRPKHRPQQQPQPNRTVFTGIQSLRRRPRPHRCLNSRSDHRTIPTTTKSRSGEGGDIASTCPPVAAMERRTSRRVIKSNATRSRLDRLQRRLHRFLKDVGQCPPLCRLRRRRLKLRMKRLTCCERRGGGGRGGEVVVEEGWRRVL